MKKGIRIDGKKKAPKKRTVAARAAAMVTTKQSGPKRIPFGGLDRGAQEYATLLSNPCGANLVHPVYASGNAGVLSRFKQTVVAGNNALGVDSFTSFTANNSASATTTAATMWNFGYSVTPAGGLGTVTGAVGPEFLKSPVVGTYRPVAGCMRVLYTGTLLNCSGLVSMCLTPTPLVQQGQAVGGNSTATYKPFFFKTVRLGEPCEIKWLPLSMHDESWTAGDSQQIPFPASQPQAGSTLSVIVEGAPAGTVLVEIDFVYEWTPDVTYQVNNVLSAPVSTNTTQHVIKYLSDRFGGVAQWALHASASVADQMFLGGTGSAILGAQNFKY